jgi:hypothetical protein
MASTGLKAEEVSALESLEKKYQVIRDNAVLVAKGHNTGFVCWGEGGTGKSYQILQALHGKGCDYRLLNTRVSGPWLCMCLKQQPKGLFVIEDVEDIFVERSCLSVLRSAMWAQEDSAGRMVRSITYGTAQDRYNFQFDFGGGVIATLNSPPDDLPELRALKTRIDVFHLRATREELLAMAHRLALSGYRGAKGAVGAEECLRMWAFYREHLPADRSPDLRLLTRAYRKVIGLRAERLPTTWEDMLQTMIHEGGPPPPETPARRLARNATIAAELRTKHGDAWQAIAPEWTGRTGLGRNAYYEAPKRLDR